MARANTRTYTYTYTHLGGRDPQAVEGYHERVLRGVRIKIRSSPLNHTSHCIQASGSRTYQKRHHHRHPAQKQRNHENIVGCRKRQERQFFRARDLLQVLSEVYRDEARSRLPSALAACDEGLELVTQNACTVKFRMGWVRQRLDDKMRKGVLRRAKSDAKKNVYLSAPP